MTNRLGPAIALVTVPATWLAVLSYQRARRGIIEGASAHPDPSTGQTEAVEIWAGQVRYVSAGDAWLLFAPIWAVGFLLLALIVIGIIWTLRR